MSAWVVSKAHIDAMVLAGVQLGVIHPRDAQRVGQNLFQENVRSVRHRYSHFAEDELAGMGAELNVTYRVGPMPEAPVDLKVIALSIDCLEYQSCEHPEWDESRAAEYLRALESRVGKQNDPPEDRFVWGIEELGQALKAREA